MKTKDLIKQLQEEDPSGELEACVGTDDISFVSKEAPYWDGYACILVEDPVKDTLSAKYNTSLYKIRLHTMGIRDLIAEDPNVFIDYSGLDENYTKRFMSENDNFRKEVEYWEE